MRRAIIRVVVLGVIAACFACPILQMFDHWDHAEAKGKDTETTLMIVALSVGLAIPAAHLLFRATIVAKPKIDISDFSFGGSGAAFAGSPAAVSQPPPILRI
ncbi:MAG TPA: hypothetical protein VNJ12_13760 [Candidatus Dormibacteraeota bacterium]|nr:hypothetical protein [Candidatus Dormibacteraeota bacterium]